MLAALIASRANAQPFAETLPGLSEKFPPCIVAGDYDCDGDLDLLISGHNATGGDLLRSYRNDTATQDAAPVAPTNPVVGLLGTTTKLSWSVGTAS